MPDTTDVKPKTVDIRSAQETAKSDAGFRKLIPIDSNRTGTTSGGGAFGQWKPTVYWYTPILMVLAAGALLLALTLIIRRMSRAAERRDWSDDVRRQSYADRPFRTGSPEARR